jgi:hypothetical protein
MAIAFLWPFRTINENRGFAEAFIVTRSAIVPPKLDQMISDVPRFKILAFLEHSFRIRRTIRKHDKPRGMTPTKHGTEGAPEAQMFKYASLL